MVYNKYEPIEETKDELPGPITQKLSSSSSSKVKIYVYLLILFKLIAVIYIFSDELSSIFIEEYPPCNPGNCDNTKFNESIGSPMIIPNPNNEESEKFITYLAHSGLHNQRIALENAAFLAWKLNRTLILPPLMLGKRFGYREF